MGKKWKVTDFIFLGSKITEDSDRSHKIKRCFLFGRKAVTSLDSVLKSRDIRPLPTKVCIVKPVVFLIIMYRCESCTIKNLSAEEYMLLNCGWRRLESPLDRREVKPVNPKGNPPWIFIGRTDAEASILWLLMRRTDSLEKTLMLGKIEGGRRRGWQRMRWLDVNGHEFE